MAKLLWGRLAEVLRSVAPIIALACLLQFTLLRAPTELFNEFLIGSAVLTIGMTLFFIGLDLGILPMGRLIGADLPKRGSVVLIVLVAFILGFATTVAEPDVLVLADQVDVTTEGAVSGQVVLYVMAVGVAIFTAIAMLRLLLGFSMVVLLASAYAATLILALLAPAEFVPLAFDAGSVTTGAVAAPVVIALAIGLTAVLAGRSAATDGFGLLGFASIGPIITVLVMGILSL